MILSNCPRCDEPFRIPSGALRDDAYAQCPWCRETFPLTEVLKSLPPVLEVLSADGQPLAPSVSAVGAGLANLGHADAGSDAATAGHQPGFLIEEEAVEEIDFDSPESIETVIEDGSSLSAEFEPPIDDWDDEATDENKTVTEETITEETWNQNDTGAIETEFEPVDFHVQDPSDADDQIVEPMAPMKVSPAPKRKKQKGTGIRTAVGVVLGGLASVPIAGLLLMALGRTPDWGFWPFNGQGESAQSRAAAPAPLPTPQPLDSGFGEQDLTTSSPADAALEQIVEQPATNQAFSSNDADPSADPRTVIEDDGFNPLSEPPLATDDADRTEPELVLPDDSSGTDLDSRLSTETAEAAITMPATETESVESVELSVESTTLADRPQRDAVADEAPESEPEVAASDASPNPATESAELASAADLAGRMVGAVSAFQGSPQERTRQLLITYKQIAKACSLAEGDGTAIQTLAATIKESSILNDIESFVGSEWLKSTSRVSDGIALVGKLGEDSDGPNLTLSSGRVVKIAGETRMPAADKVLGLGRIVEGGSAVQFVFAEPLP